MDELERRQQRWVAQHILPYERDVRRWLRRWSRRLSNHDIDDVIQEAYAQLCGKNLEHVKNGRAFFFDVVRNVLTDQVRRSRVVKIDSLADIDALQIEDAQTPERVVNARQQFEKLIDAVGRLAPQRQMVFKLQKLQGLSPEEVAERMGISPKTVWAHSYCAMAQVTRWMYGDSFTSTSERRAGEDIERSGSRARERD